MSSLASHRHDAIPLAPTPPRLTRPACGSITPSSRSDDAKGDEVAISDYPRRLMDQRLSRRGLLRASAATAAAAGLALAACDGDGDEASEVAGQATVVGEASPQPSPTVDQQAQRRRGAGLIAWDRDKAYDGYTLFAPMTGDSTVYLVDMSGKVVHTWRMADPPGLYGDLLPNGNLLYRGNRPAGDSPPFIQKGGVIGEADWEGKVMWQLPHHDQHHDARLLANGNLLLMCAEVTPPEIAARVPGGQPVEEGVDMWTDYVAEVTREGETVWEWHAWEHLEPEARFINAQDLRNEWTHGNSVEQLPDGNVLVSFRNINTVAIVDRQAGNLVWEIGPEEVAQQHYPTMLANGNILIFDNGAHRANHPVPFSRVIEVDPATSEIVWQYMDLPPWNFFSPFISGAQRLPNGNTLITEGDFGRLFEVTALGEVVWEYISPFFVEAGFLGLANRIFRAFRYAPDEVPRVGA